MRFFEGAGPRGTLELIGEEILGLLRAGTPAEQIALVAPALDGWRAPLETVLGGLGVPCSFESRVRLGNTPFGHALLQLLRYAWTDATRRELFAFLRSPYSGLARSSVDYVEGRLRGRAIHSPARVEEETEKLREAPVPALGELRAAESPLAGARVLIRSMLRSAYGTEAPPAGETSRLDLRTYDAILRLLDELEALTRLGESLAPEEVLASLERVEVRLGSAFEAGRVAVLDLMRARTRRFEIVFLLGLEEGSLPRRSRTSPFLDDDARRELGRRLERPDQVSRDRYLFYTACTRATRRLYLVREAATDDGAPREPSPFWEEVATVFDEEDVARATSRRPLSALTWGLEAAPTERERVRALAQLAVAKPDEARALADANDWGRRLARARSAFRRDTRITNDALLSWLGSKTTFGVTELERFADCSSAWLVRAHRVAEDDRRGRRPDVARLRRAQRVAQVLRRAPEGARARPRDAGERRACGRVPPPLPRRCAARRRPPRVDRAAGGRARRESLARPRRVRARRVALAACSLRRAVSRSGSAPTARRPSCSADCRSATACT